MPVSPPDRAVRVQPSRLSPADVRAPSRESYDLRGCDGLLICKVSREKAREGIAGGQIELVADASGAFLRPAVRMKPPDRERNISPPSKTLIGNLPARYRHNEPTCAGFNRLIQPMVAVPAVEQKPSAAVATLGYNRGTSYPRGYVPTSPEKHGQIDVTRK